MLQIRVGREGEALLLLARGVELDKVAGDVLQLVLGALFQLVPGAGAELVDFWRNALFATVFGELVQGVYRHKDHVVVLVDEFYHLLGGAVDVGAHQSAELAHAVVDVHDVVAYLDGLQLFERQGELARAGAVAFEGVFVETVENLMVGEDARLGDVVDKALVEGAQDGLTACPSR